MSGGGAMRAAAAKAAGITVANSGFRGITSEHPVSSAARKVVRPVSLSGISSASDHLKSSAAVSASQSTAVDGASVQRPPCWELDDWEFAGGDEEEMVAAGEPLPRLVFGGAPSLQEAKQATFDLKDALHKVYMSTPPSECGSTNVAAQLNKGHSLPSNSSSLMTQACVTGENTITHGRAPKHAIRAFKFLYENHAAQTVVASIASDPNVWNAVLANPELQEFLVSQKTSASVIDGEYSVEESVADTDFLHYSSPRSDDGSSKQGNGFTDFLQNIKVAVIDMMNCLSDFFQNLFGGCKVFADADGSAKISVVDRALGASFMGLAIMVIMVVVLKRA